MPNPPTLPPHGYSTCVVSFDCPDGRFERRVWSYETPGPRAMLYDVTHNSQGQLRYRVNMGVWQDTPASGIHDAIVQFYRLDQPGRQGWT